MSNPSDKNMRKVRKRKLSPKDRIAICDMYATGRYTYAELAKIFNVHKTRISHIIKDTYGEMDSVRLAEGGSHEEE